MNIRIRCSREKVKELMSVLQRAYERGDIRGVKQISAILRIHEGQKVKAVAELFDVTVQTGYNWLKAFLLEGCASFQLKRSPGRKPGIRRIVVMIHSLMLKGLQKNDIVYPMYF